MTVWWNRRGVYEPPDVLTPLDLDWLSPHLRLAGLSDEDPPSSTAAAAMVGAHQFGKLMRGDRCSYANAERQSAMDKFIAEHYNPGLVGDGDDVTWRRRCRGGYSALVDAADVPPPPDIASDAGMQESGMPATQP